LFLDLKKAYDTLDRGRTIAILKGYGVGDNLLHIIQTVWDLDTIVPKQASFFSTPFRATRGVRQGDILSAIIFNIVSDAVIRWVYETAHGNTAGRPPVDSKFYADDGNVSGEDPAEVQQYVDLYTEGFNRVGMETNAVKTKAMIMDGGTVRKPHSAHAYKRQVTGEGVSVLEYMKQRVKCELCGKEVNRQYLEKHKKTQTCVNSRDAYEAPADEIYDDNIPPEPEPMPQPPADHQVSMPEPQISTNCPVPNCPATPVTRTSMRQHFRNKHSRHDRLIIEEEGLLPRCEECGMFSSTAASASHRETAFCKNGTATYQKRKTFEENQRMAAETVFTANGEPIETVKDFKYLGRILSDNDSDEECVERNLKRAKGKWGSICRILSNEGASPKIMGTFYKTIVQSVLLYGSESWVLTKPMIKKLQSFHRRCARYITGMHIRPNDPNDLDGEWTYPPTATVLEAAGLWPILEYIRRRRETVLRFASERYIYRKCLASSPLANTRNLLVWWH
jgi:hypothetical protein